MYLLAEIERYWDKRKHAHCCHANCWYCTDAFLRFFRDQAK